ncbi:TPA: HPr family phosphocarrier protein, partial [Aeromonas hydrophila]|nr:HPr family phosphocarrier protein [Aeromonas hydrophila]
IAVMNAIEEADDGSGVLVLMDLGSALLSAETALELLPPELSARVRLCPAPLVEGTLAAVVAAGSGLTLDEVAAEALGALGPKQAMLPGKVEPQVIEAAPAPDDGWLRCEVVVDNPHGLHVRPAARLVAALKPFAAELRLQKEDKEANPRSLTRLTMLNVRQGDRLTLLARGEDAEAALACFQQLAAERFGD